MPLFSAGKDELEPRRSASRPSPRRGDTELVSVKDHENHRPCLARFQKNVNRLTAFCRRRLYAAIFF